MPRVKVRLRGIYATALTILLSERFEIVDPSAVIQARLGLPPLPGPAEVQIFDRPDRHGVVVEGVRSGVEEVVGFLREKIPWALVFAKSVQMKVDSPLAAAAALLARFETDFPHPAKELLDAVRAQAVPTLPGHHLLKTIDPARVDTVEEKTHPQKLREVAQEVWEELVGQHYACGRIVTVWHLKAGEHPVCQSGEVLDWAKDCLILRRNFRAGGIYDGLGLPKKAGDYGLLELRLGEWWGKRRYFRADGTLIGEIYNIHTPPELLPEGIRYVDLEVDVVHMGEDVRLIDKEILERKVAEGLIPEALAKKAGEVASKLVKEL